MVGSMRDLGLGLRACGEAESVDVSIRATANKSCVSCVEWQRRERGNEEV